MLRLTATRLICMAMGAAAFAAPAQTAAQTTLAPATTVTPGSPEAGFGPTAYAETNHDFQAHVRGLDAAQRRLAEIAERRASPNVQAFAKQVRVDFSGGRSSLKGMSDDQGVPVVGTATLAREHQTLIALLQADNADVDRLFVDFEVLLLREALGLVEPYAAGGTDARWRQAAAEAASEDRTLLAAARGLQKP